MKKSKVLLLAGITLLAAGTLAACSNSGSKSGSGSENQVFNYIYETDPENLNYLTSGKATTHNITANIIDGLLENDSKGNLVPSIAEDWTVSKDGLTYTYKLRKGVKWYTSDGEEYAEVNAQDFVTGLKHAADQEAESLYLVQDSIKGLDDYVKGNNKDFSSVGVKAVDDNTVEYTLNKPEAFWNSKTTTGILYPVNKEFLESKGDKFAQATDPTSLLYNGPFILKSLTAKSSIEFTKNENYWDKDNVHVDGVKLAYFDGQDQGKPAEQFAKGVLSLARLSPTAATYSKIEKEHKDNIVYDPQDATSYVVSTNIDRQSYNYTAKTTDAQKESTKKALLNKDFRQALVFAFDRNAYAAQVNGKEGANKMLRNQFVPPAFVQAGDKTFGELVKDKLASYGDEWKDVNLSDAQDGLYDASKAKAEFEKAKAALQAEGVEFPIHLDMPVDQAGVTKVQRVQSLKQSVEKALGAENVVVDIHQLKKDDLYNITYYAASAAEEDWDISDVVGWGPDYQDPSTYLDILKPGADSTTKTYFGFQGADNASAEKVGLKDYANLIDEAGAETADLNTRYEKFAAAQAWLTDSALIIPTTSKTGRPILTKVVPFSTPFAWSGDKGGSDFVNYKYMKLQNEPVTAKEYQEAQEKWEKERVESNKKEQEDLAKHVK